MLVIMEHLFIYFNLKSFKSVELTYGSTPHRRQRASVGHTANDRRPLPVPQESRDPHSRRSDKSVRQLTRNSKNRCQMQSLIR